MEVQVWLKVCSWEFVHNPQIIWIQSEIKSMNTFSIYSFIHTKIYTSLNAFIYRKSYSKSRHSFLQLCQHTSFSSALNILQKSFYFIAQKAWVQRSIFKSRMLYFFPPQEATEARRQSKDQSSLLNWKNTTVQDTAVWQLWHEQKQKQPTLLFGQLMPLATVHRQSGKCISIWD